MLGSTISFQLRNQTILKVTIGKGYDAVRGSGTFGEVFYGKAENAERRDPQDYAVKRIKIPLQADSIITKLDMIIKLEPHRNLMQVLGYNIFSRTLIWTVSLHPSGILFRLVSMHTIDY